MLWYEKIWYKNSGLSSFLSPLSYLYRFIIFCRHCFYQWGFFQKQSLSVPVVVVGNLTVGGTGKTPFVIALAKWLQEQGERPGIVTRGYGGRSKNYPVLVSEKTSVFEVGDEPLLISRHSDCPVMVDPRRSRAAQALIEQSDCTIIISDDGLQHTALARDIEILLIDAQRRFGNKQLLPAGPLREPLSRLNSVDFIVSKGEGVPDAHLMTYQPGKITNLCDSSQTLPEANNGQPVFAFAGIANPNLFYEVLTQQGFECRRHSFPDHYRYDPSDFSFTDSAPVIMTEKDAVKCEHFALPNWWYLPISASMNSVFWTVFKERLEAVKKEKADKEIGETVLMNE